MRIIRLPRDAYGRVLDPATGELVFDPVTGEQRVTPAIVGHLSTIIFESGESPYFPPGWEHLKQENPTCTST